MGYADELDNIALACDSGGIIRDYLTAAGVARDRITVYVLPVYESHRDLREPVIGVATIRIAGSSNNPRVDNC